DREQLSAIVFGRITTQHQHLGLDLGVYSLFASFSTTDAEFVDYIGCQCFAAIVRACVFDELLEELVVSSTMIRVPSPGKEFEFGLLDEGFWVRHRSQSRAVGKVWKHRNATRCQDLIVAQCVPPSFASSQRKQRVSIVGVIGTLFSSTKAIGQ